MDVAFPFQVFAVVAFAYLGELFLRKGERHIQKQRHVRTGNSVIAELQVEDPPPQLLLPVPGRQFGALEPHVRIDIPVEHDGVARIEPTAQLRGSIGPVTGEKQSDQIRIDLVHSPEFTPQEAGDQLAVHRRVETRKMEKMALHPLLGKHAAHKFHLGRFPGAVQSFQYYQHILDI